MATPLHNELKKEFQLERMILFSDAVFAIAITLLVLEIRVPNIDRHTATDKALAGALDEMVPKFIGFLISFFIIGMYWAIHHRMFGFVVNYSKKMIWMNLMFLLAVVLMPFSTAIYSEYILRYLNIPVIIYVTNIVFLGVMNFLLWRHISDPKLHLSEGLTKEIRSYFSMRALTGPAIFITMALTYIFLAPKVAVWIPPMIPVIMRIATYRIRKKLEHDKSTV
ncbi:MAG TPA: TMEM175 family protein [Flavisolibacter sp.]|nr:TMEM175 family protein [Flavisolibacter sp.]